MDVNEYWIAEMPNKIICRGQLVATYMSNNQWEQLTVCELCV